MKELFAGMILGLGVGAIIATNSIKARKVIAEKQQEINDELSKITKKATAKSK